MNARPPCRCFLCLRLGRPAHPDRYAPVKPPRTPEDDQTVATPEQGRPIATRKDPA